MVILKIVVDQISGSRESLALADANTALTSVTGENLALKYNPRNQSLEQKNSCYLTFYQDTATKYFRLIIRAHFTCYKDHFQEGREDFHVIPGTKNYWLQVSSAYLFKSSHLKQNLIDCYTIQLVQQHRKINIICDPHLSANVI